MQGAASTGVQLEREEFSFPQPTLSGSIGADPVLQTAVGPLANATAVLDFEGLAGGADRPDANGAVGAYQFVESTNFLLGIYSKATGQLQYSALANVIFQGFQGGGSQCANVTLGDAVVLYDHLANRWIVTYIGSGNQQCLALSVSEDAGGLWYRYAFQLPSFGDYPKLGVWSDGYYMSFNFSYGTAAVALHRDAMLTGGASSPQCFQLGIGNVFPSDLDGSTLPPSGSPNYFMTTRTTTTLSMYRFYVDFSTPANSRLDGPIDITVAPYQLSPPFSIPQAGTSQLLQPRGATIMHRVAYRNFGGYQSMVLNHEVGTTTPPVSIRWYELRNLGNNPAVQQQGTFSGSPPDSTNRWVGSIAMDALGDIALGYSVSSSAIHPGIQYTGRVPTDPTPGTLEAETTVQVNNQGSKTDSPGWGDYTSMSVDPVFDCSFWYTNQYFQTNGFNWNTHIASFRFPSCMGCVGDCNRDHQVTSSEVTEVFDIAQGLASIIDCLRGDANGDGVIDIFEVRQAYNNSVNGCPVPGLAPALATGPQPGPISGKAVTQLIGSASGVVGAMITIPVTLENGGSIVSGTEVDFLYPASVLANPQCVKASRLNDESLYMSFPSEPAAPTGDTRLRAMIIDLNAPTTFADGLLFSCTFTILPSAQPGTYVIGADNASVSDAAGNELISTVTNGSVTVQ